MAMGFGCNAVGVTGCRIIASPRERLLAILTNSLVPCNGKFPILIAMIGLLFPGSSFLAAAVLTGLLLLSAAVTFLWGKILSRTVLSGQQSDFILELPPYRRPQIGRTVLRSVVDRTVIVLGRAVVVAAPAGAAIWLLQNVTLNAVPLTVYLSDWLDPVGQLLGMSGVVLLAFLLAFPANELFLPLTLSLTGVTAVSQLGWSWQTGICVLMFSLFHWPCSTTCLTIRKETGSWLWTLAAVFLPTVTGAAICLLLRGVLVLVCS